MTDHLLRDLGIRRIECPLPFPEAGGPSNVYVIEERDGGYALFDSGLGTPAGEQAVRDAFAREGLAFEDVRRIVLSHGHIDHYGLAQTIGEASGAPVSIHERDRRKVHRPLERWNEVRESYRDYLASLGIAPEGFAAVEAQHLSHLQMARPIEHTQALMDGDELEFARFSARVLHSPGHTPGLVCLWVPEHGVLFSDDHLLEKVSPNPLLELGPDGDSDKFRSLVTYLDTLARTRELPIEVSLPGHGAPFAGARAVIDRLLAFYERRQTRILEQLAERPVTAPELVAHLFPRLGQETLFLTLSEVIGNLEVLEERRLVDTWMSAGVRHWSLAEAQAAGRKSS